MAPKNQKNRRKLVEEAARETKQELPASDDNDNEQQPVVLGRPVATTDWIAQLSESILEDPEGAFVSTVEVDDDGEEQKRPSKMRQLLLLASDQTSSLSAKLALLSLLAIFKDILPSYRIRLPSTKEMAVKVSKDTKKLWDYEQAMLAHYQDYLKLLEKTWDQHKQNPDSLAITAILCLCELLKSAYHFNFRSNLLTAVIRPMNHPLPQISQACCTAVGDVLAGDAQGQVALEATRQVAKMIRDRHFKVQPKVLQVFTRLPLRVHVDEAQAAKLATQANAKKRKRDKETAEIESEFKESQATVDKIVLARCQSDMLQAVTLTYFRILKSEDLQARHIEEILPAALEGLAKFAHLINIDTVMDLLDVLKGLLKRVDALPLDATLNCVLTAFQTLQGPGKEMKIDQKEYILPLYSQLPRLCSETASYKDTETMLKCLSAAFLKRREFSTVRIAAFIKQILTVALHAPAHTSAPLLALVRQMLQRYPSAEQLLENEQDVITSGQYNPNVDDPEYSNPFATSGWELATLRFHVHPATAGQAEAAAAGKMLQLPSESPERIRAELLADTNELYIPFVRHAKKHPLEHKQADNKRRQIRFVTPRKLKCTLI